MKKQKHRKPIVFLDIDGVLQPTDSQKRFDHDLEKLQEEYAEKDEGYRTLCRYDIAAVLYDWDQAAVENLRRLLEETEAEIVVSSDWRSHDTPHKMPLLLRIHDLEKYYAGQTVASSLYAGYRAGEIFEYLLEHPDISRFVILDDRYMKEFNPRFPGHCVDCYYKFEDEQFQDALTAINLVDFEPGVLSPDLLEFEKFSKNSRELTKFELGLHTMIKYCRYHRDDNHNLHEYLCNAIRNNKTVKKFSMPKGVTFSRDKENIYRGNPKEEPSIYEALCDNQSITHLDLSSNSIYFIKTLLESLMKRNIPLDFLALRDCYITTEHWEEIMADFIIRYPYPLTIDLRDNSHMMKSELAKALSKMPDITVWASRTFGGYGSESELLDNFIYKK